MKIWLRLTRRLDRPARKLRSGPVLFVIDGGNKAAHSEDQSPCPCPASAAVCLGWRWEL